MVYRIPLESISIVAASAPSRNPSLVSGRHMPPAMAMTKRKPIVVVVVVVVVKKKDTKFFVWAHAFCVSSSSRRLLYRSFLSLRLLLNMSNVMNMKEFSVWKRSISRSKKKRKEFLSKTHPLFHSFFLSLSLSLFRGGEQEKEGESMRA